MDYSRADRAERLAAEYALGTLRGPARRRFEQLLPAHPALRNALTAWHLRLQVLATPVEPVTPPERVWAAIEQRLFPAEPRTSWWSQLAFWRVLSATALAALLVAGVLLPRPADERPPVVVVLTVTPEGAQQQLGTGFVASVAPGGDALVLKPLGPMNVSAARALELWAVPTSGAPRSLGLLDAAATATVLRKNVLTGTAALAVSLEPAGGSPTGSPTGPIVSVGKI